MRSTISSATFSYLIVYKYIRYDNLYNHLQEFTILKISISFIGIVLTLIPIRQSVYENALHKIKNQSIGSLTWIYCHRP